MIKLKCIFDDEDEINKSTSLVIIDSNINHTLLFYCIFFLTGDYRECIKENPKLKMEK